MREQMQTPKTSKQQQVIDLLSSQQGATLTELCKATGWQAHSVHGLMSGVLRKKLGLAISHAKDETSGKRIYRIDT